MNRPFAYGPSPSGWRSTQLRAFLSRRKITGRSDLPLLSVNLPRGVVMRQEGDGRPAPSEDLSNYQVVSKGDLVMNQLGKPHGALGVSPHDGIISPAYFVARVGNLAEPRFVHHLLRTRLYISEYERRGKFMPPSQFDISWEQFRSIEVLLPPRQVQRAIADFLDAETVRIDALIEKKQRMVELLDERLNSYRVRTVLGMTRDVQLRQSPSGLYGLVPTSWAETSLRHLGCEVQTGPFGSQLHAEDYIEGGWPVVNPMNLVGGTITPTPSMAISDEKRAELSRHILRAGDIVFGRRGEMGRAGLVGQYETGWLCGTGSLRLRLVGSYLSPTYLKLLLETPPARAYFELASVGSTMDNLNSEIVLDFPTLVPTLSEQDSIASAVAEMLGAVNRLGMALGRQLSIARERRQALITAAVTGELDIPGMAA